MRSREILTELAQNDIDALHTAAIWKQKFISWMETNNENTPLGKLGLDKRRLQTKDGVLNVFELPAFSGQPDDLRFGIGWFDKPTETRGYMMVLLNGRGERQYMVILLAPENPTDETDVMWSLKMASFDHEVIHYLDHKRGYDRVLIRRNARRLLGSDRPRAAITQSPQRYYNDPLEFNAHFQQAVGEMLGVLASNIAQAEHFGANEPATWLESFEAFLKFFKRTANRQKDQFLQFVSPSNKRKIATRLYKLFDLIRRSWPNIPAIQQQARVLVSRWQAQDQADLATDATGQQEG